MRKIVKLLAAAHAIILRLKWDLLLAQVLDKVVLVYESRAGVALEKATTDMHFAGSHDGTLVAGVKQMLIIWQTDNVVTPDDGGKNTPIIPAICHIPLDLETGCEPTAVAFYDNDLVIVGDNRGFVRFFRVHDGYELKALKAGSPVEFLTAWKGQVICKTMQGPVAFEIIDEQ
ncbi:MAG: hypothetical protein G01um101425_142 [Candidatus Peregrinibacteria bacterium Gr01-1014_25]|nr:MAG: hypothetical protein G01um101425_142 [Candidatus Peregrinibacteria bacterium Gr01-1014_25]